MNAESTAERGEEARDGKKGREPGGGRAASRKEGEGEGQGGRGRREVEATKEVVDKYDDRFNKKPERGKEEREGRRDTREEGGGGASRAEVF